MVVNETQKRMESICTSRVSLRHALVVFSVLTALMVVNLMTSSSRLSLVFDVTMRMKSNVMDAFYDLMSNSTYTSVNGTLLMRSLTSNSSFVADYKVWLNKSVRNNASGPYMANQNVLIDGTKVGDTDSKRPDICSDCFNHNFNYVINNENICKSSLSNHVLRIVIFITTVHANVQKRNAIRQTWLTYTKNNTGDVRYAFLLGQGKDQSLQDAVAKENNVYRDIIQEDFVDAYNNLTFKSIMAFKYAATKCAHAQYVMKTDDDMFVNIPNLLKATEKYATQLKGGLGGACHLKARPIRDTKSKWFASIRSYPKPDYPGFCSGTGYVTSLDVARKIYEISPSVPFFHLEDVYAAICINKLGLKLTMIPGFNAGRPKIDPCAYKHKELVTSHGLSPAELLTVWNGKCG